VGCSPLRISQPSVSEAIRSLEADTARALAPLRVTRSPSPAAPEALGPQERVTQGPHAERVSGDRREISHLSRQSAH